MLNEKYQSYFFFVATLFRCAVSIDFTKIEINSPHSLSKRSTSCWDFAIFKR